MQDNAWCICEGVADSTLLFDQKNAILGYTACWSVNVLTLIMHKPFNSVIILARFELDNAAQNVAAELLDDVINWRSWLDQIELHGLSGYASKHISAYNLPVPQAIKLSLKGLNIRHRAASVARFKALQEISTAFKAESLDWLALKGAALMPYIFKVGELRPMRDMDILMPREQLPKAAELMRELGYDLPEVQPSKFMRDMHQLPNASKTVDGFYVSVELHRDGISREVPGHFYFPEKHSKIQHIDWQGLDVPALADFEFVHQVSKHLEGLHNGALLKLINVMDVIGLAEHIAAKGELNELAKRYPHVINTLRCLHVYTPLPVSLQQQVGQLPTQPISGVGEIMVSLRAAMLGGRHSFTKRVRLMLRPSDWWLYLYYNANPNKSLVWIKWVKHPLRILNWLSRRAYSRLLGG
jgi:hypothetical protein